MIITALLVLGFGALVLMVPMYLEKGGWARKVAFLLLGAYVARLLILGVASIAEIGILTAGDAETYEYFGWVVARRWMLRDDIQFLAGNEGVAATVSLPINVFALIFYAIGGPSRLAATSLIAGLACLTAYNLYVLACELGAEPVFAFRALVLQLFIPAYLVYTSNTFKDGIVAFLAMAAFGAAVRLSRKLSLFQAAVAAVSLVGLYNTRFYMVVMTGLPVLASLAIAQKGGLVRRLVVPVLLLGALGAVGSTRLAAELTEQMESAYSHATEVEVLGWNSGTGYLSSQGSGVTFDDGGDPFARLGPKIAYTLFSPFPWMGGSFALQVGKIDALIWYYLFYRMLLGARRLWREDRALLSIFVAFLVPSTIAYATTMANVGLIVRQRIPIVMVGALLAMMSWPKRQEAAAPAIVVPGDLDPTPPVHAPAE